MANLASRLMTWPQYLLPKHALTALAWRLSLAETRWFKNAFIGLFAQLFRVNLDEAQRSAPDDYRCFNDFFTRELKADARPISAGHDSLVSPCDGTVSQLGRINQGQLIQAKGIDYGAAALLGSPEWAKLFLNGRFVTIYLAPSDYHRVHMPVSGRLLGETRIPGDLFSVSAATTLAVPGLFSRNERMAALFETENGPVAVVMVAAMLVSGIETVWGGPLDRRPGSTLETRQHDGPRLERGAEMGRFHWGSTVIVLTPEHFPDWRESLAPGRRVRLGQAIS
ncbi:MAG: archaetidylserine decarboxylase [Wenzhouxiangella sp.]